MPADAFDRLTDRQKECLRLVLLHYDSKQIARQLGVGHHAVNKRIEGAIRHLGVADRYSAARLLAEHENGPDYERLVYEQIALEPSPQSDAQQMPSTALPGTGEGRTEARDAASPSWAPALPDPIEEAVRKEGIRNELTAIDRMKLVGLYAFSFLIALALLANVGETIRRTLLGVFNPQ